MCVTWAQPQSQQRLNLFCFLYFFILRLCYHVLTFEPKSTLNDPACHISRIFIYFKLHMHTHAHMRTCYSNWLCEKTWNEPISTDTVQRWFQCSSWWCCSILFRCIIIILCDSISIQFDKWNRWMACACMHGWARACVCVHLIDRNASLAEFNDVPHQMCVVN